MNELIKVATTIGYAYLVALIFAVTVAIIMSVVAFKFFKKFNKEWEEMEQQHKEMRNRFASKHNYQNDLPSRKPPLPPTPEK